MSAMIACEEFVNRLAQLCLRSGATGFPRRLRDRHILMKSVALTLEAGRDYSERELDDRLLFWLADIARSIDLDHVTLRRYLVDDRYLVRERDGSSYRAAAGVEPELFDREVEDVDVYVAIGQGMKEIKARKRAHSRESLST